MYVHLCVCAYLPHLIPLLRVHACEPLYGAHVREETSALLFVITQIFQRGTDGKCTTCDEAEGHHYHHSNGNKYCYVSTTCPPPHVFVLRASGMY